MMPLRRQVEIQSLLWGLLLVIFLGCVAESPAVAKSTADWPEVPAQKAWDTGKQPEKEDPGETPLADEKKTKPAALKAASPETASAPPAPYRVYPSPYVPDVQEPRWGAGARGVAAPEQSSQTDAVQTFLPPLDPGTLEADALMAKVPAAVLATGFFPILPLNAAQGAVAQWLPYASNRALMADQSGTQRAIIFIHDLSRNASDGVAMLTTLAGNDNGATLVVAPQFPLDVDIRRFAAHLPDEGKAIARWPLGNGQNGMGGSWQVGGDSIAPLRQGGISSFTAIDLLLLYLADRRSFPQLQQVIIAGHGMGADFVQRYVAVGQSPDLLTMEGLPVRYLVANASSYLYFTGLRPAAAGSTFAIPQASSCRGLNDFPYGLGNLIAYARRAGTNAIRLRYPERRVMYLLSEKIPSDMFLDRGCAANMQGKDRLTRGRNYERYLRMSFGESAEATHTFARIPNAGYDPVALLGSYCGQSVLFGDGTCSSTLMPH